MSVLDIDKKKIKDKLDKVEDKIKGKIAPTKGKDRVLFRKIRTAMKKKNNSKKK